MKIHLFLTGEKQVGKSTVIRQILDRDPRSRGGFFTVKSDAVWPGRVSMHLLRADREERPDRENFVFFCPPDRSGEETERFDRLGCTALASAAGKELIVMDELGPGEARAAAFQAAVLRTLDGSVPVLGVLQEADSPFLRRIAEHPQVQVCTVTEENRDTLAEALWLDRRLPSYGAVVLEQGCVLMVRSGRHWSFPKGHIQPGETPVQAAVREVLEETGIAVEVDGSVLETVPSARPQDLRTVTFFPGRSLEDLKPPVPQPGELQDAAWVPVDQAPNRIRYQPDRAVLEKLLRRGGR